MQADAARKEFAEVNAGLLRGLAERDQQVVHSLDRNSAPSQMKTRSMDHGEHGVERRAREEEEREREEAPLALRAARPDTVGYAGGCDQVGGEMECPHRSRNILF